MAWGRTAILGCSWGARRFGAGASAEAQDQLDGVLLRMSKLASELENLSTGGANAAAAVRRFRANHLKDPPRGETHMCLHCGLARRAGPGRHRPGDPRVPRPQVPPHDVQRAHGVQRVPPAAAGERDDQRR